ncbi:restriction endonuclease subunit S [Natrarchaeobaculum aegyptiacum]|uniref:Type I restriction modification DNA specificity domain-containing protein n=1 Tax=Natrarchaeobaculum aegyptiacum TaxID=745377 RepID=A0A2Z2HVE7_9EURY|nr:restriction endonuclease subunit S [Natrarchaeobaculum aegyptiacum]ARS91259.1 hypothetical protein B1756_17040 [Natrarchaeobaculum aegyptiacum]
MSEQVDITDYVDSESKQDSAWVEKRLGEVFNSIYSGGTPKKGVDEYYGGNIPFVKIEDLNEQKGEGVSTAEDYVTKQALEETSTRAFDSGTLLLTIYGSLAETAIVQSRVATNQAILGLWDAEEDNVLYVRYAIDNSQPRLESLSRQTTQANLGKGIVKKHKIPIPPLPEQRKIATVLYTVDRAIKNAEAIVDRLERFYKGLYQSLIPRGVDHEQYDNVRILGRNVQIPVSWDVTTVSEACSEIIDYRGKNPEFSDEGIPHLRNINIERGEIILDDLKHVSAETYDEWMTRGIPQEGDTLLSTEAPMGKAAVLPEMKFSLSQRLIVLRPGEQFDNRFFAHLMGSPFVQKEYEARATGSTVKGISNYNLQEVTIPVPPMKEQEEIAQRIDETLDVIQINEQEVDRLKRLKRGLMQDLLSGTVQTTDTTIEVPEEVAQYG